MDEIQTGGFSINWLKLTYRLKWSALNGTFLENQPLFDNVDACFRHYVYVFNNTYIVSRTSTDYSTWNEIKMYFLIN